QGLTYKLYEKNVTWRGWDQWFPADDIRQRPTTLRLVPHELTNVNYQRYQDSWNANLFGPWFVEVAIVLDDHDLVKLPVPDDSPVITKFGNSDDNDPTSGERYTQVYNKAWKKAGGNLTNVQDGLEGTIATVTEFMVDG
ncbi:RPM1-interacting protein 4-like protein isoform X2, partial [Tanacetum coccineum]